MGTGIPLLHRRAALGWPRRAPWRVRAAMRAPLEPVRRGAPGRGPAVPPDRCRSSSMMIMVLPARASAMARAERRRARG